MRILTASQMKQAEADAVAAGTSYEQLMENAGRAAAAVLRQLAGALPKSALLLCGKGNNAGDAFVVARVLAAEGWRIGWVPLCGEAFSPLAQLNLGRVPPAVRQNTPETAGFAADFIVDGVFGTGFKGALPPNVAAALRRANGATGCRVALDLPSGLDCDTGDAAGDTFRAAHTLTFGAYKPALVLPAAAPLCGEVHLLDIGL